MFLQAELILRVITLWFLVLSQLFRDGMGPFNANLKTGVEVKKSPKEDNVENVC